MILMGYYNPIYIYGVDALPRGRQPAGVDGLIVVDLPPEEDEELCLPALKAGLAFIRLATPTTDDKRLPTVLAEHLGLRLLRLDHRHHRRGDARLRRGRARRCRASSATPSLPVAVGFGVKTPEHAAADRAKPPTPSWSAPRSSRRCAPRSMRRAAPRRQRRRGRRPRARPRQRRARACARPLERMARRLPARRGSSFGER